MKNSNIQPMKNSLYAFAILVASFTMSCEEAPKKKKENTENATLLTPKKSVAINLNAKSGSETSGMVSFEETDSGVKMVAHINGLEPGMHAIHIHQKADCSSEDGKSSGGHWNPTFKNHGAWGDEAGYHKGDIGNFTANEEGHGMIEFQTDEWCLGCDDDTKNILGKAIIVHQGKDDMVSQPSGAAGARVSCAGIIE